MTTRTLFAFVTLAALLPISAPALAHHSANAEFDTQKIIVITGTLTKLEVVSPHSWWYLEVKGPDGKVTGKVSLTAAETQALLQQVPAAYNTQINDVLLTALARAWNRWTGSTALFTNLEGHGRENLFEDVDLSRTLGWFTSIFPVLLQLFLLPFSLLHLPSILLKEGERISFALLSW